MRRLRLVLLPVLWWAAGCGSPGEPQPPSLGIPEAVRDLEVEQYGSEIRIRFTLPGLTTDGVAVRRLREVELLAGPSPDGGFDRERWIAGAERIPTPSSEPGPVRLSLPAERWIGREIIFGVRTVGRKGRPSEWSNLVARSIVPPLAAPASLQAEAIAEGVRLRWSGAPRPGLKYRVFRRLEPAAAELLGETEQSEFTDTSAAYGASYEYAVQAVLAVEPVLAFSEPSPPVRITPQDRFPPAVPSGLRAASGVGSIELFWDRNTEADLRGYFVWRASGEGPLERFSQLLVLPSYSDRQVRSGERYRYAVTAVDQRGNESAPSSPVEVIAP